MIRANFRPAAVCVFLFCFATAHAENPPAKHATQEWMQTDETVVPIRENISRSGEIMGFLRKGQVVSVLKTSQHWVKVRANDTLEGWVPLESMEASGPPVHLNPSWVKVVFFSITGLGLGVFLYLAISLQRKRRAESQERARQAMADAKRRLQNKVQLLFRDEPLIHSHLAMNQIPLRDFLQGIGYIANLESDPERFLTSCKTFKPNLIVAGFDFLEQVEKVAGTDAMLINTPVVYLQCGQSPSASTSRVRAYLETNASEKELSEAIVQCLKRSPEKIHYSVKPVALKGGIHAGTLMELLYFLAAVKKSGQLLAVSGSSKGEMRLYQGNIAKASMQGLSGASAADAILNLASGSFEFHERDGEAAAAPDGTLNTQKILMDWTKAKDESNHHSRA